jgi:hypothetical protein
MQRREFIAGLGSAAAWPSVFILLAVSGMSGFVIGKSSFSWPALIVAGAVLATLGAVVFQGQGFTALPGICTIVGCLVVNQVAYVLAIRPKR